jgi:hypothetical protein
VLELLDLQQGFESGLEVVLGADYSDMDVFLGGFVVAFVYFHGRVLPEEVGLTVSESASNHNLVLHNLLSL